MRRANVGMRFVLPDRDQLSSADLKKPSVQEKKKPILLRELENELRHLDEIDDDDFGSVQDPYLHDGVLDRLQMIAKEAVKHDLKEIEKLCKLAIGKRILNIELKKKKDEHYSKLRKKQKIELFFRQNRIKRYNYDSLMEQKLKDNALVAKAYQNGKGFIESVACYQQDHEKALAQCEFLTTIKEVNRIFYNNYSSLHRGVADSGTDTILRLVWIPIAVFVCLAISLPFASFLWQQLVLMGLLAIILVMLLCVSVKTFLDKPNSNNQIEQTMEDVQAYFETLNQRHLHRGSSIEWNCSKDFMYLEVVFHNGLPT